MQRFTSLCFQHAEIYITLFLLSTNDGLTYYRAHDEAEVNPFMPYPAEVEHAEIFEMGNDDQGAFHLRAGFNIRTLRTSIRLI